MSIAKLSLSDNWHAICYACHAFTSLPNAFAYCNYGGEMPYTCLRNVALRGMTMLANHSHIHSVAMLADFHASQWTARKIDKPETEKVLASNHVTSAKAAHVSKKLVKSDKLDAIAKCVARARDFHKRLTSPWSQDGARILSVANYAAYNEGMEVFEAEFEKLVPEFVADYPDIRDDAANVLGSLFKVSDYPQPSRIAAKFAWHSRIFGLPNEADFRCDIGDAEIARVRLQITSEVNDRVSLATIDCFERAHKVLAELVEKIDAYQPEKTGRDKGTFRDTATENVAAIIAELPALNFTGDARITQLCADMAALIQPGAKAMRLDNRLRNETVAKAKAMVEAVSDMMA